MTDQIIWRIENARGQGPYYTNVWDSVRSKPHRPAPREGFRHADPIPDAPWDYWGDLPWGYRFGFPSLLLAWDWIGPEGRVPFLQTGGAWHVQAYRVPADRVYRGRQQVIFDRTAAAPVARIVLSEERTLEEVLS